MRCLVFLLTLFVSFWAVASNLDQLIAKANAGDEAAQYQLGTMYNTGQGVERNPDTAFTWFQKAARQGNAGAMYNLGVAYYNGDTLGGTLTADAEQAWIWFTLAAEKGDNASKTEADRVWKELGPIHQEGAEIKLADVFLNGEGVPADPARAVDILKSAPGSMEAQLKLAQLYIDGKSVPRDLHAAQVICEPLDQSGSPVGAYCMGVIAEQSQPADYVSAAKFYERAARGRDRRGAYRLAALYALGNGVQQNNYKAYVWCYLAKAMSLPAAEKLEPQLAPKLSAKEIGKAQKEAGLIYYTAGKAISAQIGKKK
jgi:hypothetical protein